MITPAYSPTATERVLPRLALDFTTAVLDSRVAVTRALNTATRINSSGYIENVNADLPRFDYDPVNLTCKGLLIEETRANLLTYSQQANNGIWSKVNTSVTPDTVNGPDGLLSADTITAAAGTSAKAITQAGGSSGVQQTYTAYIKAGTHNFIQLWHGAASSIYANFNVATGAIGTVGANATAAISGPVNGFYRLSITCTPGSTNQFRIAFITSLTSAYAESWNALGTETVYFGGAQLEAGAFATSYIPTTTTSLTRNADAVSMTGTNFSSWYNASESTIVATGSFFALGNNTSPYRNALVGFSDGTSANAVQMGKSVAGFAADRPATYSTNGSFGQSIAGVPITASSIVTMALGLKTNSVFFAANGVAGVEDTTSSVPPANQLGIGSFDALGPSSLLNGYVRSVRYYPLRLTNAEIQAFSKG